MSSQATALDAAASIPPVLPPSPSPDILTPPAQADGDLISNSLLLLSSSSAADAVSSSVAAVLAAFTPAVCPTPAAQVDDESVAADLAAAAAAPLPFPSPPAFAPAEFDIDALSTVSSSTHASRLRTRRGLASQTVALPCEEAQSSTLVPLLSGSDVALLRLSCEEPAPVTSLLASSLPAFLSEALTRVLPSAKKRHNDPTTLQRLMLAIKFALQINDEPDQSLLAKPKELLIAAYSESLIPLGRGFRHDAIGTECALFSFPPGPHRTARATEVIDAACRILLRTLKRLPAAASMLELIHDNSLPEDSPDRFSNMPSRVVAACADDSLSAPSPVDESPDAIQASNRPDGLQGVTLLPISGEGNQCWYRAVGQALGLSPGEISAVLRDTLESIDDIPTLCRYGLLDDPLASSVSAGAAKTAYLASADFVAHANGGTVEMYLLSHDSGGDLSFLVVDPTSTQFKEPLRRYCSLENHLDVRIPTTRKEIVLHFCSYSGCGSQPNHYELFRYEIADGSSLYKSL